MLLAALCYILHYLGKCAIAFAAYGYPAAEPRFLQVADGPPLIDTSSHMIIMMCMRRVNNHIACIGSFVYEIYFLSGTCTIS